MKKRRKSHKRKGRLQVITLCISTSLVLILLGMVVFFGLVANNLSAYVKENLAVTVLFDGTVSNQQAQTLCKKLQTRPYVSHIDFISSDQALKEQTKALGADPSEFLGVNPFTPSAEIYLHADYANSDSIKWITKRLRAMKQVEEVTYQQDLMNSVNKNLRKIGLVLVALATLLIFVSFSLIDNTVRLSVYARRFTINTMKLVGASWSFIRAPFIKMGIVEGIIAALVANCVLGGLVYALYTNEPEIVTVVTPLVLAITAASVFVFGVTITTLCVYFSVTHFLKMRANQMWRL